MVTDFEDIPYEQLLGNIHCKYCSRIILLDYSKIDYASPDTEKGNRPVPRDPDTWEYHRCLNKRMVRMYETGTLDGGNSFHSKQLHEE